MTHSMRGDRCPRSVILCLLSALFATSTFAQTFGDVTGRISDASGIAVPGVTFTLTSASTNAVRTAVSTESRFQLLVCALGIPPTL